LKAPSAICAPRQTAVAQEEEEDPQMEEPLFFSALSRAFSFSVLKVALRAIDPRPID